MAVALAVLWPDGTSHAGPADPESAVLSLEVTAPGSANPTYLHVDFGKHAYWAPRTFSGIYRRVRSVPDSEARGWSLYVRDARGGSRAGRWTRVWVFQETPGNRAFGDCVEDGLEALADLHDVAGCTPTGGAVMERRATRRASGKRLTIQRLEQAVSATGHTIEGPATLEVAFLRLEDAFVTLALLRPSSMGPRLPPLLKTLRTSRRLPRPARTGRWTHRLLLGAPPGKYGAYVLKISLPSWLTPLATNGRHGGRGQRAATFAFELEGELRLELHQAESREQLTLPEYHEAFTALLRAEGLQASPPTTVRLAGCPAYLVEASSAPQDGASDDVVPTERHLLWYWAGSNVDRDRPPLHILTLRTLEATPASSARHADLFDEVRESIRIAPL